MPRRFLVVAFCLYTSNLLASSRIYSPYTFTRIAGYDSLAAIEDGPHTDARFSNVGGLAADSAGNLYVADSNNTIRKISATGMVTTLAGMAWTSGVQDGIGSAARFKNPHGLAVDREGNIYVADTDNNLIRKITPAGVVTTLAGQPYRFGGVDGPPGVGLLDLPGALTLDSAGNLYVVDGHDQFCCPCAPAQAPYQRIRKITPAGNMTTFATGFFSSGSGITADAHDNLFIGEHGYWYQCDKVAPGRVIKVTPEGTRIPLASFSSPAALAADSNGSIYIADSGKELIYKLTASGALSVVAGTGAPGKQDGPGNTATFYSPSAITVKPNGSVYVGDLGAIREITPASAVSTYAGVSVLRIRRDGVGDDAIFDYPLSIAVDHRGNAYVAEIFSSLRKVSPAGVVTTLPNTPVTQSAVDGGGNVYFIGNGLSIMKMSPTGTMTTLASTPKPLTGIAADRDGTLYGMAAANFYKVTPDGVVTEVIAAGNGITRMASGNDGRVYWGHCGLNWYTVPGMDFGTVVACDYFGQGGVDGPVSVALLTPAGDYPDQADYPVAIDDSGKIFLAENYTIRQISGGLVTTLAGSLPTERFETDIRVSFDGTGPFARFGVPRGIAVDTKGTIYIADGNTVRIGRPAIGDTATIDRDTAPAGEVRQLRATPQTASTYKWEVIRRPVDSSMPLSSTTTANPTFTPDGVGLFIFRLTATSAAGSSITLVKLETTAGMTISSSGARLARGLPVTFTADVFGLAPTGTVQFYCDGARLGDPVALNSRTAAYTTATLPVGTHVVTATYSGDGTNGTMTSAPINQIITETSAIPALSDFVLLLLAAAIAGVALRRVA